METKKYWMTFEEAKEFLQAKSAKWLCCSECGTFYPHDSGGAWYFKREDMEKLKARLDVLRDKNARGDMSLPDECADENEDPPLL